MSVVTRHLAFISNCSLISWGNLTLHKGKCCKTIKFHYVFEIKSMGKSHLQPLKKKTAISLG